MTSPSTVSRHHNQRRLVATINTISEFIRPLSPPVDSLAREIRCSPFRILISVVLSSRTKDAVTANASRQLFAVADTPEKLARLSTARIGRLIYPVGFYRQKAKNLLEIGRQLSRRGGKIPKRFQELVALPGVGRKTANLVLAQAFNRPAIAVDTHVFRISRRLGWSSGKTPSQIEADLKKLFPRTHWRRLNHVLVGFGQTVCLPIGPKCGECILKNQCPSAKSKEVRRSRFEVRSSTK